MGRPTNGIPYLKGGIYHIRFSGEKNAISLDTKSASIAQTRARSVIRARGEAPAKSTPREASPVDVRSDLGSGKLAIVGGGGPPAGAGTSDPLSDWQSGDSVFDVDGGGEGGATNSSGSGEGKPMPTGDPVQPVQALKPWEAEKRGGLSLEDKERVHGLLAGVVGRVNVLALGFGVRIFGRIPAEPEPADMELLNKAWSLQLNILLENKDLSPALLIAAASAGLGISMYVNGEDKPKKESAPDGSVAHSSSLGG